MIFAIYTEREGEGEDKGRDHNDKERKQSWQNVLLRGCSCLDYSCSNSNS